MTNALDPSSAAEFGYQLAFAARRWRRTLDEALAAFGVTEATWRALIHLDRLGNGARQNDLARSLGVEGPSLVRLLDRLEASRLLVRREDAADRRAKTLHLTAEGQALTAKLQAVVRDACAALVDGASAEELEACARIFRRVIERTEGAERP